MLKPSSQVFLCGVRFMQIVLVVIWERSMDFFISKSTVDSHDWLTIIKFSWCTRLTDEKIKLTHYFLLMFLVWLGICFIAFFLLYVIWVWYRKQKPFFSLTIGPSWNSSYFQSVYIIFGKRSTILLLEYNSGSWSLVTLIWKEQGMF